MNKKTSLFLLSLIPLIIIIHQIDNALYVIKTNTNAIRNDTQQIKTLKSQLRAQYFQIFLFFVVLILIIYVFIRISSNKRKIKKPRRRHKYYRKRY